MPPRKTTLFDVATVPTPNLPSVDAWEGFDFLTLDSGMNGVIANYAGAPSTLRGVDDLAYARETKRWWGTSAEDVTGLPISDPVEEYLKRKMREQGGALVEQFKALGLSVVGVLVALIVLAVGLYVIAKD